MKKNLLMGIASGALLLGAASCSNDDINISNGEQATVSVNLSLPQFATRAYSDGLTAKKLSYAVYNMSKDKPVKASEGTQTLENGSANFRITLTNGTSYRLVFWADSDKDPYTVNFGDDEATVSVDYSNVLANDENLDAFYKAQDISVNGNTVINVDMVRPFAQINIGTNDKDKAAYSPTHSSMTVAGLATSLDLLNDKVGDETADVTFGYNLLPLKDEKYPVKDKGLEYLGMVYALVGENTNLSTVSFGLSEDGTTTRNTITVNNVPLQRNHRTNLYGALLTNDHDVNISITPGFDDDDNYEVVDVPDGKVQMNGVVYESIKDAIEAMEEPNATIYVGAGNYNSSEQLVFPDNGKLNKPATRAGVSPYGLITIKGSKGSACVFTVDKGTYIEGKADIAFENLKIVRPAGLKYEESTGSQLIRINNESYKNCVIEGCVRLLVNNTARFDNCTFNNTVASGFDGYGIYYYAYSGSNVTVNDCVFNMVSKAIVLYSEGANTYDLTVNNCKFFASKKDDKAAIQMHSEYKISGTVRINNSTAVNFADKFNNGSGGLWNEEDNTYKKGRQYYFDVFVDGKQVQTTSAIEVDGNKYYSIQAALEAAQEGSEISFPNNGNVYGPFNQSQAMKAQNVTINGNGAEFRGAHQLVFGPTVTLKNARINTTQRGNGFVNQFISGNFEDCVFQGEDGNGLYVYTSSDVTFTRCKFIGEHRALFFGENKYNAIMTDCEMYGYCPINGTMNLVFDGCKFLANKNDYAGIGVRGPSTFKKCQFNFAAPYYDHKEIAVKAAGVDYEFVGCTVNGEALNPDAPYFTVDADGTEVTIDGNKKTLSKTAEKPKHPLGS